jgi:uncharacterized protein
VDFDWDAGNLPERHRLDPAEVEAVVRSPNSRTFATYSRQGEPRAGLVGSTDAGRILVVVYTIRGGRVRVVTAYPASPRVRRWYREHEL